MSLVTAEPLSDAALEGLADLLGDVTAMSITTVEGVTITIIYNDELIEP